MIRIKYPSVPLYKQRQRYYTRYILKFHLKAITRRVRDEGEE